MNRKIASNVRASLRILVPILALGHFAYEFMAGCPGKAVIAALQLQIGGANSRREQTNPGKPGGNPGQGNAAQGDGTIFKMNG